MVVMIVFKETHWTMDKVLKQDSSERTIAVSDLEKKYVLE
jgi:hypothetical protein